MRLVERSGKNIGSVLALLAALLLASAGIAQAPDEAQQAETVSAGEADALAWTDQELAQHLVGIDEALPIDVVQSWDTQQAEAVRRWVYSVEAHQRGAIDASLPKPTFISASAYTEPDLSVAVPDSDIEELVIRGTQTTGLVDVPIAVTQFNAADIQSLRIKDVADLAQYTPNLEINTAFSASNPTLFIRGIGLKDYNANAAGAVAIWQDDVHMVSPAAQLFSLFDISNIEVLRGPQGGLRGRNAYFSCRERFDIPGGGSPSSQRCCQRHS